MVKRMIELRCKCGGQACVVTSLPDEMPTLVCDKCREDDDKIMLNSWTYKSTVTSTSDEIIIKA